MTVFKARMILFLIWTGLFLLYELMMLSTFIRGIPPQLAQEAAWNIGYVLCPVLSAFASFWFLPRVGTHSETKEDNESVQSDRVLAMFVLTGALHLIVIVYFVFFLLLPNWANEREITQPFDQAVSGGLKLLVFFSSVAVLPVGWVLNPKAPITIDVKAPRSGGKGAASEK